MNSDLAGVCLFYLPLQITAEFVLKILAVIPARYDSTRLAGKVLLKETGKFLIEHTYLAACGAKTLDDVIIAADDQRVLDACGQFGAKCIMTSRDHQSGTDRIAEAVSEIDADIVINVQGDEPEIEPAAIDALAMVMMDRPECMMGTLVAPLTKPADISNTDIVKCIVDVNGRAIYFSRLPIPYSRDDAGIGNTENYLRHVGMYAYRKEFLQEITKLPQSMLEKSEKLEQLRVIENGYDIYTARIEHVCSGIDTAGQYEDFVKRYNAKNK